MYGELTPQGGGDPIPLLEKSLLIGRRESCDIVLRFGNVSGQHCQLTLENGYWFAQDMNSQNGTKVNGNKIVRKRLDPGDTLSVAKHKYTIHYSPKSLGASGPPPSDEEDITAVLGKSLLERAGLDKRPDTSTRRYDPNNASAGQMRKNYENE
jgi:predicted component of type VI protein secretion system